MSATDAITPGQIRSLRTGISTVAGKEKAAHIYIVAAMLDRSVIDLSELSRSDWNQLRNDIYPGWPRDDWEPGTRFKRECAAIFERYREEVLGHRRLF